MSDNIKWALRKMVNEITWMDDETKNATLRKLANTITLFGYPDDYIDILNNSFKDVKPFKLFLKYLTCYLIC